MILTTAQYPLQLIVPSSGRLCSYETMFSTTPHTFSSSGTSKTDWQTLMRSKKKPLLCTTRPANYGKDLLIAFKLQQPHSTCTGVSTPDLHRKQMLGTRTFLAANTADSGSQSKLTFHKKNFIFGGIWSFHNCFHHFNPDEEDEEQLATSSCCIASQ
ncbi:hypothetical protein ACOSP7_012080 [Xanthoceras sorbifolium]